MSKLKLNIQYFGSTNKTTHYDLSQYVASDKPTYLIDYNQDMAKIDAGIYDAMSKATVNESNIGTMQDLTTTVKSSLVSAINEINTQLGSNTANISTNTSNIATLGTNQGDLVNLMTTAKNNLVSAINELKGVNDTQNTSISDIEEDISNLPDFNFVNFDNLTFTTSNGTISEQNMKIAANSDYSIIKLYGKLSVAFGNYSANYTASSNLRPSENITINPSGMLVGGAYSFLAYAYLTIATDGTISISLQSRDPATANFQYFQPAYLIFLKDFGDTSNQ